MLPKRTIQGKGVRKQLAIFRPPIRQSQDPEILLGKEIESPARRDKQPGLQATGSFGRLKLMKSEAGCARDGSKLLMHMEFAQSIQNSKGGIWNGIEIKRVSRG